MVAPQAMKDQPKAKGAPAAAAGSDELRPVLMLIQKRLRNKKKALRGIEDIQAKAESGRELNADQEASLAAKPGVVAVIEELEKLGKVLTEAVDEEVAAAAAKAREQALEEAAAAAAKAAAEAPPVKPDEEWEAEREEAVNEAVAKAKEEADAALEAARKEAADAAEQAAKEAEEKAAAAEAAVREAREAGEKEALGRLVEVLYCSALVDPFVDPYMVSRHAIMQQAPELMAHADFEVLLILGKMLTLRPNMSAASHAESLELCKKYAASLLRASEEQIAPYALTYKEIVDKVQRILALPFFTGTAAGQAPPAAGAAAPPASAAPAAPAVAPAPVPAPAAAAGSAPGSDKSTSPTPGAAPAPPAPGQNLAHLFSGGAAAGGAAGGEAAAPAPAAAPEVPSAAAAAAEVAPPPPAPSAALTVPAPVGEGLGEQPPFPPIFQPQGAFVSVMGAMPPGAGFAPALAGDAAAFGFAGDAKLGIEGVPLGVDGGAAAGPDAANGEAGGAEEGMRGGRGGRGGGRGDYYRGMRGGRGGQYRSDGPPRGYSYGGRAEYGRGPPPGQRGGYRGGGGGGRGGEGRGRGGPPGGPNVRYVPVGAPGQAGPGGPALM